MTNPDEAGQGWLAENPHNHVSHADSYYEGCAECLLRQGFQEGRDSQLPVIAALQKEAKQWRRMMELEHTCAKNALAEVQTLTRALETKTQEIESADARNAEINKLVSRKPPEPYYD